MVVLVGKEGSRAWVLREMRSRFLGDLLMTLRLVSLEPDLFLTQFSFMVS